MKNPLTMIALAIIFNVNAQKYNFRTTGNENDGFGVGEFNTASGLSALANIIQAEYNSAFGNTSLNQNKTGNNNTASGFASLLNNIEGSNNSAFGFKALHSNESGNYNTACGYQALYNTKGNSNTGLGYDARTSIIEATNQTVIGYNAIGRADNSVTLGNPEVTAVYMGEDSGAKVYAGEGSFTGNMTIGGDVVVSSDARLKANIMSLGSTLAKLLLIDGKTYTMKNNGKQKIGVLAQDIQKVFPELVTTDDKDMLAVNYQGLVPVLINALKEQDDKISRLEKLVEKLISDN